MTAYIGEIQLFAGSFAPEGWKMCNGQLLPIAENEALFSIIGTTYGGDGQTTFAVPNFQDRVVIGTGQNPTGGGNHIVGEMRGEETSTLTAHNLPPHTHTIAAKLKVSSAKANKLSPENNYFGLTAATDPEYSSRADKMMNSAGIDITLSYNTNGDTKPVNNMQPFVAINYIIATEGIYPSPT